MRYVLPIILTLFTIFQPFDSRSQALCGYIEVLDKWVVGEKITELDIELFGIDNCFKEVEIDGNIFSRIYGKSYKEECSVLLDDLRYLKLLHYDKNGNILIGELICNVKIADDLLSIFRSLYEAKYPIEKLALIDNYNADDNLSMIDNNSSCFNFRYISGTKRLSNHSQGMAIDINPLYNPYVKKYPNGATKIEPIEGEEYVDRSKNHPYMIKKGDLCYQLFIKHGFSWGGNWRSSKDYQHFEKMFK